MAMRMHAWRVAVDRPDVVSMIPQSPESVKIIAIASGQAVVSATVQGVVGKTGIDVTLSD